MLENSFLQILRLSVRPTRYVQPLMGQGNSPKSSHYCFVAFLRAVTFLNLHNPYECWQNLYCIKYRSIFIITFFVHVAITSRYLSLKKIYILSMHNKRTSDILNLKRNNRNYRWRTRHATRVAQRPTLSLASSWSSLMRIIFAIVNKITV